MPSSLEASDVLDFTTDPTLINYTLRINPPYYDGYDFSYPAGANVCFDLPSPTNTQVLVGPNRTPVTLPFNMETLGPC